MFSGSHVCLRIFRLGDVISCLDKTGRLNYSMMAPLLWNYCKYYNCSCARFGLLRGEKKRGPVGSEQHQVTENTPKYSLNDGLIGG